MVAVNPERKKKFSIESYQATHPVLPEHDGMRLDTFVMQYMTSLSRQFLKTKISKGEINIKNREGVQKPSTKVRSGDRIEIITYNPGVLEDELWRGNPIKLEEWPETIFEDENIIVCSKPAFMITHPAGKHLFYCATVYYESIHKNTIHSIHRLDRETSGLLLLGKNSSISNQIANQFEAGLVKKCYLLISH